jgi:hypothetical protein
VKISEAHTCAENGVGWKSDNDNSTVNISKIVSFSDQPLLNNSTELKTILYIGKTKEPKTRGNAWSAEDSNVATVNDQHFWKFDIV